MHTHRLAPLAALMVVACSATTRTTQRPAPEEQRRGNSTVVHVLGIPPGHLPRAGQCRVWIQGRAPGRQARARSCRGIVDTALPGSWIIYRPGRDNSVHVHVMDPVRPTRIYVVRFYNANGRWLKDETSDDHQHEDPRDEGDDRNENRDDRGRRRPQ